MLLIFQATIVINVLIKKVKCVLMMQILPKEAAAIQAFLVLVQLINKVNIALIIKQIALHSPL